MLPVRYGCLVLLCLALNSCADQAAAGYFSERLERPEGGTVGIYGFRFDDRKLTIRIMDEGGLAAQNHGSLASAVQKAEAVAGSNGGFFTPEGQSLGLVIADGSTFGRIGAGYLNTGMIVRTGEHLYLWRKEEYKQKLPKASQLLQAGPFLLDKGKPVKGLSDKKPRKRTIIGHDMKHLWWIAVTDPISLHDLAIVLAESDEVGRVRIKRVLNLDGGSSSALWVKSEGMIENHFGNIRNYLMIVPKESNQE